MVAVKAARHAPADDKNPMAYAVSIGSGYSRFTVRFPNAAAALEKAQDEIDHGAENVAVMISATQERLTVPEFKELVEKGLLKDRP